MKKKYMMFILVFIITLGYAAVSTKVELIGKTDIKYNEEDFRVEITNLKVNNILELEKISEDKQSFKYQGSGNEIIEYTVTNYSYQYDVKINLICNPSAGIEIEQIGELKGQSKENRTITSTSKSEVTCTIGIEKISRTDYAEEMCKIEKGYEWKFDYTGSEQEFIVPCDGEYKIELWGAQGGSLTNGYLGGYGGYSKGNIKLNGDNTLYINIGGKGNFATVRGQSLNGGYNGGGNVIGFNNVNHITASGGGATHIAFISGQLSKLENYKNKVIIVSGGGGGGRWQPNEYASRGNGGSGGGYIGVTGEALGDNKTYAHGGTQNSGGKFEYISGTSVEQAINYGLNYANGLFGKADSIIGDSAGGGGYYGGSAAIAGGGGGSGYIGNPLLKEKEMCCYKCQESNEEATKTITTTCTNSSPISNCAKQGHGYAKITYLGNNN